MNWSLEKLVADYTTESQKLHSEYDENTKVSDISWPFLLEIFKNHFLRLSDYLILNAQGGYYFILKGDAYRKKIRKYVF